MHTACLYRVFEHLKKKHCLVQAGLRLAPGVMQALLLDYNSVGSEATLLQPHIADAAATFLKLTKVALLSKE